MEPESKKLQSSNNVVYINKSPESCLDNSEILHHIFQYLGAGDKGRAAQVCKKWHEVIYETSMWDDKLYFFNIDQIDMELVLRSLKCRKITRLVLVSRGCYDRAVAVERFIFLIHSLGPIIKSLCLDEFYVNLSERTLEHAFNKNTLSFLENLQLNNDFRGSSETIRVISKRCPYLLSLHLPHCSAFTDDDLIFMTQHLTELTRLDMRFCEYFTDVGLLYISIKMLHLTSFTMKFTRSVTNAGVNHLTSLPLKELSLYSCLGIDENCIDLLLPLRQSLEHLDIAQCPNLNPNAALVRIAKCGFLLQSLTIGFDVTKNNSPAAVNNNPGQLNLVTIEYFLWKQAGRQLEHFDLLGNPKYTDLTGASIVENCPKLKFLYMRDEDVTQRAFGAFERMKKAPWKSGNQLHKITMQRSLSV